MDSVPIAWFVTVLAGIAAFTVLQSSRVPQPSRWFLASFLIALAGVSGVVGARISLDVPWAGYVQPLIGIMVAPLAFFGFVTLTQDGPFSWRRILLWHGLPLLSAQAVIALGFNQWVDILLFAFTSFYSVRLALVLMQPSDRFVHVPDHAMPMVRGALVATLLLLLLMILIDLLILTAVIFIDDSVVPSYLSGAAGALAGLVLLVALIGTPMVLRTVTATRPPAPASGRRATARPDDDALFAELMHLIEDKQLYQDSGLTLARVARRLGVPARDVSQAVNLCTGENFSRFINGFRVAHAKQHLRETDLPITDIMLDAGFISKSSFNTEFRRIVGQTPSAYRASPAD